MQPYPGPGGKWQISTEGGTEPVWARNGRELFYRSGDKMMAVEVSQSPDRQGGGNQSRDPSTSLPSAPLRAGSSGAVSFSASTPKVLFEGRYEIGPPLTNYDVSPDGQRFLMIKSSEQQQAPTQINVVLNWFEELRRKVPAAQ